MINPFFPFYFAVFVSNVVLGYRDFYSTCPTGFNLLSCGNDNYRKINSEANRKVFPIDSKTCQCYDHFGMYCVAWCTTLPVPAFEIKSINGGYLTMACPSGKQVLGCHLEKTGSGSERWRRYFPSTSGSSCTCYDYYGANCIASCGSVANLEVVSLKSSRTFTTSCSNANNRVLGCGIDPHGAPGSEDYRYVRVASETSCECYDYYGTICFAICGKIW